MSSARIRLELADTVTYANGDRITPRDYVRGLQRLAAQGDAVCALLLGGVELGARRAVLEIRLPQARPAMWGLLRSVDWLPIRSGDGAPKLDAGSHTVSVAEPGRWTARWNAAGDAPGADVAFELVRDPLENVRLARAGAIDQTADTATPLGESAPPGWAVCSERTHLRMMLIFDERLATAEALPARRAISRALRGSAIARSVGWQPVDSPFDDPEPLHDADRAAPAHARARTGEPPLTMTYHDFYPNASVAYAVASALAELDLSVVPVVDAFPESRLTAPLRLAILQSRTLDTWGRYASMAGLPAWNAHPGAAARYARLLRGTEPVDAVRGELDDVLAACVPAALIAAVPSHCFSRIGASSNRA